MDLKQISFQVKIKDPKDNTRDFPIQRVYTNDLNSVRLTFEMIDTTAAELSGATASILFYMLDRSFFQDTATVTGNKVEYTLTEAQGNHAGMAQVQIMVTVGGVVYASAKRKFDIVSGLEMAVATEVMIKDWTMLTAEAREYLDEAEANEAIRISNETARVAAENQRNNDFSSKADQTYTDAQLATKADKSDTYTKAQVDGKDALKADKTYTDTELAKKADKATTYTKTEVDTALLSKAPAQEVSDRIANELLENQRVITLPNGISDEIRINSGISEYVQRNKKKLLQASDIFVLLTTATLVDSVVIYKPTDGLGYNNALTNWLIFDGYTEFTGSLNNLDNINKFRVSGNLTQIELVVAKGTFATLTDAKNYLVGKKLTYQLATPITTAFGETITPNTAEIVRLNDEISKLKTIIETLVEV